MNELKTPEQTVSATAILWQTENVLLLSPQGMVQHVGKSRIVSCRVQTQSAIAAKRNQLTSHVQAVRIFEQTEDLLLSKRVDAQSGDRTQYLVDAAAAHLHDHLTLQNRKLRSISRQSVHPEVAVAVSKRRLRHASWVPGIG